MMQSIPIQPISEEISRSLDREDLEALVDVFRTLLEWERKYGGDIEKSNGSDNCQSGI